METALEDRRKIKVVKRQNTILLHYGTTLDQGCIINARKREQYFYNLYQSNGLSHLPDFVINRKISDVMDKRVLIVEDNELNLKLFCDLLRAHEFVVEPVRDGREALIRVREFHPDLIIMDIQMPYVSGYELIREIVSDKNLQTIPIMAVTAYAGPDDEERIRAAGAQSYISKPITLARFLDGVNALL